MRAPTLYLERQSGLHALHPTTKLALSGLFLTGAAVMPGLHWLLALFAFGLLPLAAWGQVARPLLRTSLALIWPFALSLLLIQGFFAPGEQVLFRLGPLALKQEGLLLGALFTARILVWLGTATLLMLITRPDHLMQAFTEQGLPHQISYIVLATIQIIPRFQAKAQTILDAQRSRGLETEGLLTVRLRALLPLIGPLILGSILDVDERAMALEARAFSRRGPKTYLTVLSDSLGQRLLRWLCLLLMVAMVLPRLAPW
jgi:energy-coupling factor transport system permease protein